MTNREQLPPEESWAGPTDAERRSSARSGYAATLFLLAGEGLALCIFTSVHVLAIVLAIAFLVIYIKNGRAAARRARQRWGHR